MRYLIRNGMDAQTAEPTAGSTKLGVRLPERLIRCGRETAIELGGSEARVVHTPGHSDFHFVLHDERRRLLFAGDHLLLKITPNIGLWTYTAPRPLRRYLDSSRSCGARGPRFPGTARSFTTWTARIDELLAHHEERLSVMLAALDGSGDALRGRAPRLPRGPHRPPAPLRARRDARPPRTPGGDGYVEQVAAAWSATGRSNPVLANEEEHARLIETARGDRPADLSCAAVR